MMGVLAMLPPAALAGAALCLGLVVGSFLNVVIHRLPLGESLVRPGSRCPRCGAGVRPWHNVPVLSWLWLRGRCRSCRAPISPRYPAIELLTGLLFAAVVLRYSLVPMTLLWWLFAAALVAAAAIDFEHRLIPDEISLGGLAVALVGVPLAQAASGRAFGSALLEALAGALLGGGLFWLVGFAHARLSCALGREFEHWPGEGEAVPRPHQLDYWIWFPGVGFGDVKLLAMIGAVQGVVGVLETLIAASLAGLALGLAFALATRRLSAPFGFAPALALGALLVTLVPHEPWLGRLGH
jgi:leader peptidase (prepilin peptidase)/N-methyltransferase